MGEINEEDEAKSNHSNIDDNGNMAEITVKTIGPSPPSRLLLPSPIKVCLFISSSLSLCTYLYLLGFLRVCCFIQFCLLNKILILYAAKLA
jgi:hypothetical protein